MESWKSVIGWEGYYEVSDMGRVRSVGRYCNTSLGKRWINSKVLKNIESRIGYAVVNMTNGGRRKQRVVHRMVIEAFLGPCPDGMEACHINGDRMDARLCNLRWDTRKGNHADKLLHGTWQGGQANGNAKLTWDAVEEIRASNLKGHQLSLIYGVSTSTIFRVKNFQSWDSELAKDIGCYG